MLAPHERDEALRIAVHAVTEPLSHGRRWLPSPHDVAPVLREPGASFVTLRRDGHLLGCIGSLVPHRPLGVDVAHNAAAAAFDDPRLPAVTAADLPALDVHVSVLGPLQAVPAAGWRELADSLRPGLDGLLVTDERHRATFLPSVWSELATPRAFLDALWVKAGMRPGVWSEGMQVSRYVVEEFGSLAHEVHPLD